MADVVERMDVAAGDVIISNLPPGEYGFLPPNLQGAQGASAQLGKMYTFSIIE